MSAEYNLDNAPRIRRIVQAVMDLRRGDVSGARVLDLGCAHGGYTLEFARRGATALGIDGRPTWVSQAAQTGRDARIDGASFACEDVRTISRATYGAFDVVLCLGLLYHLDASDALGLLRTIHDMCTDFAIIDTQVALGPDETRELDGETYAGWVYREHVEGASPEEKAAMLGASLDDELSFWFTRSSLFNALKAAGFTSVMEVRNPLDNMYLNGELKLHEDVVTLVAMKGRPIGDFIGAAAGQRPEERWPEAVDDYILERPWTRPKAVAAAMPPPVSRLSRWRSRVGRAIRTLSSPRG